MPPPDLAAELRAGAEQLGCELDDQRVDQLLAYLALMRRWGEVYNLSAVREPGQILTQHLLDSLALVPPLQRYAEGRRLKLLDVGSGGGLPGVVLAIVMNGQLEVTCIDSVAKKTGFIRQVSAELGLRDLAAVHARVERLNEARFDVIVARAFASLIDFVSLSQASLAPRGIWIAMKGQHPTAELAALPTSVTVFHVEQLRVPGLGAQRRLVWMRPADADLRYAPRAG